MCRREKRKGKEGALEAFKTRDRRGKRRKSTRKERRSLEGKGPIMSIKSFTSRDIIPSLRCGKGGKGKEPGEILPPMLSR